MADNEKVCENVQHHLELLIANLKYLGALPPQADVVQSVVGPQDAGVEPGESGRWPDRQIIAKHKAYLRREIELHENQAERRPFAAGVVGMARAALQHLEDLERAEGQDGL